MRTRLAIFAATLALQACGTGKLWVRPGATEADFDADAARCRMMSAYRTPPAAQARAPLSPGLATQDLGASMRHSAEGLMFFDDCMMSQGWSIKR